MPDISKRLSVEGPDGDGDFEITIRDCTFNPEYTFINRGEADALIRALGGMPLDYPGRPRQSIKPRPMSDEGE